MFSGGLSNVNAVFKNAAYGGFLVEVRLGQKDRSFWVSSETWGREVRCADGSLQRALAECSGCPPTPTTAVSPRAQVSLLS